MITIKKVLLATDFTDSVASATGYAKLLARKTGAQLHILFAEVIHGQTFLSAIGAKSQDVEAASEGSLFREKLADELSDYEGDVVLKIERGVAPAPTILDYAAAEEVDVIVVGTHGRRGPRHLVLGSVAEEIVRFSNCPVVTVRPDCEPDADGERSIAVPIDFSEFSRYALSHAKALSRLLDARLDLIHVIEEYLHPAFYGPTLQSVHDVDPDLDEKVLRKLQEFNRETPGYPSDVSYTVVTGHTVQEIISFVEERESDLLVMGTHGLTGLERFALGSVSERVVRRSPCPVFAVKSFGKQLTKPEDFAAKDWSAAPVS